MTCNAYACICIALPVFFLLNLCQKKTALGVVRVSHRHTLSLSDPRCACMSKCVRVCVCVAALCERLCAFLLRQEVPAKSLNK